MTLKLKEWHQKFEEEFEEHEKSNKIIKTNIKKLENNNINLLNNFKNKILEKLQKIIPQLEIDKIDLKLDKSFEETFLNVLENKDNTLLDLKEFDETKLFDLLDNNKLTIFVDIYYLFNINETNKIKMMNDTCFEVTNSKVLYDLDYFNDFLENIIYWCLADLDFYNCLMKNDDFEIRVKSFCDEINIYDKKHQRYIDEDDESKDIWLKYVNQIKKYFLNKYYGNVKTMSKKQLKRYLEDFYLEISLEKDDIFFNIYNILENQIVLTIEDFYFDTISFNVFSLLEQQNVKEKIVKTLNNTLKEFNHDLKNVSVSIKDENNLIEIFDGKNII